MILEGYGAVITGVGSGLGVAAARRFREEGARVVVSDVDAELAQLAAHGIDPAGRQALALRCDVTSPTDCAALVEAAEAFFAAPVDVFLANAGVGFRGDLLAADVELIRRVIEVNVTGSILSAQAALASLVRSPRGCLLFTSSLAAVSARPMRSVYAASKHALVGLVKALTLEFGPRGVRINAIAPAATDTRFLRGLVEGTTDAVDEAVLGMGRANPLGRLPSPEDFAEAALFLASPAARSITGHTLLVDCGAAAGFLEK